MPTPLTKLTIKEISAVDVGANPHAHIRLFKRDHIGVIRAEFPDLCAGLDDDTVAANLGGRMVKTTPATETMTEAERKRRLDSKNKPGAAARHPVAAPGSSAVDGPLAKSATASDPLTKGGVQVLWDHGVAELAKRDSVDTLTATKRFLGTEAGQSLFRAFDDPSIPAGPAPQPYEPPVQSESVQKHREQRPSTAQAEMRALAKAHKDSEAAAGRPVSDAQAFSKVYQDPKNAILQLKVRVEEGRA